MGCSSYEPSGNARSAARRSARRAWPMAMALHAIGHVNSAYRAANSNASCDGTFSRSPPLNAAVR